ncbi:MAG: hypothetical protein ACLQDL_05000 [Spirochaetia bacterium]
MKHERRILFKIFLYVSVVLVMVGCATTAQITKRSANYIQKGMVSSKFIGSEFFMVVGEVDLYHYNIFGNLEPSGRTVEISAAVQANKDTGEILRIATMQPDDAEGVMVAEGVNYGLADLRGGISVIDIQPYPRWLEAVKAMRSAVNDLGTYTTFADADQRGLVVVAVSPGWWWWWGGRGYWHRHYYRW